MTSSMKNRQGPLSYSSHKQHSLTLQIDVFLYLMSSDYDKIFWCTGNLSSNDLHVFFMDVDIVFTHSYFHANAVCMK